jgi:hypothetical protein
MDAPNPREALEERRAMRRRLYELAETQRWVHHVADLDSGELVTTPLDRPVTPLSRAERLSRLGDRFDPSVFFGPSQRLTPSEAYQPSPEAWLEALNASVYTHSHFPGAIWWDELPQQFSVGAYFGLYFEFAAPPVGPSVASISLYAQPWHGGGGALRLRSYAAPDGPATELVIPVDPFFGEHIVDFKSVIPPAPLYFGISLDLRPGIKFMAFDEISLRAAQPWVEPEPPID